MGLRLVFFTYVLGLALMPDVRAQPEPRPKTYRNTLAITPLRLVFPTNIGPELTYQRMVSDKLSLQGKAAWIYGYTPRYLTSQQGGRLGAEIKFFVDMNADVDREQHFHRGTYIGLELDGGMMRSEGAFIYPGVTGPPEGGYSHYTGDRTRSYGITKGYGGLSAKLGYQFIQGRFFFDAFMGIGLRLVNVKYSGISDDDYAWHLRREDVQDAPLLALYNTVPAQGTYFSLAVPLNIRLGFAF